MAGDVLVNGEPVSKAGQLIEVGSEIRIRNNDPENWFVSRGALKLLAAMNHFSINAKQKIALDIGSSTGGFSHVLLLKRIKKIYAVDVGTNQMDWKIRKRKRVILKEGINARYLGEAEIPEKVDIVVVDVSFISLRKVIPNLLKRVRQNSDFVTLIKPQFEVGPDQVGKGGIVSDSRLHVKVCKEIQTEFELLGLRLAGLINSPIRGQTGNQEFLAHWIYEGH